MKLEKAFLRKLKGLILKLKAGRKLLVMSAKGNIKVN